MTVDYHNRRFRALSNSSNGETSADTIFHYQQVDNIVTATYAGGSILRGHLIAVVDESGSLDMRYHQVNAQGQLMTGWCHSVPEVLPTGKIRLHERWQWTSGDLSAGESIIEEI